MATRYILAIIAIMATLAVCFSADYGNTTAMPTPEGYQPKPEPKTVPAETCPDNR